MAMEGEATEATLPGIVPAPFKFLRFQREYFYIIYLTVKYLHGIVFWCVWRIKVRRSTEGKLGPYRWFEFGKIPIERLSSVMQ